MDTNGKTINRRKLLIRTSSFGKLPCQMKGLLINALLRVTWEILCERWRRSSVLPTEHLKSIYFPTGTYLKRYCIWLRPYVYGNLCLRIFIHECVMSPWVDEYKNSIHAVSDNQWRMALHVMRHYWGCMGKRWGWGRNALRNDEGKINWALLSEHVWGEQQAVAQY